MYSRGKMKKGFTLAEIMIALTIIGVIMAILLPVAQNSLPNEKVMKFKKANATLHKVINELVTSGEYYTPGDLGKKPDGSWVEETNYLCNTIADNLTLKNKKCEVVEYAHGEGLIAQDWQKNKHISQKVEVYIDELCANIENIENFIITADNVTFFELVPGNPFGLYLDYGIYKNTRRNLYYWIWDGEHTYNYEAENINSGEDPNGYYNSGFYYVYKVFCMDIDGTGKGEDPFGYGIRVDGKILLGARAQEWLEKSIQDKE